MDNKEEEIFKFKILLFERQLKFLAESRNSLKGYKNEGYFDIMFDILNEFSKCEPHPYLQIMEDLLDSMQNINRSGVNAANGPFFENMEYYLSCYEKYIDNKNKNNKLSGKIEDEYSGSILELPDFKCGNCE